MNTVLKMPFRKGNNHMMTRSPEQKSHSPSTPSPASPSVTEILRYRYHHGPNIGSIFVLERWLYASMFAANSANSSELDAVTASIATLGVDATRAKWEAHWASALPEDDLRWLSHIAHCTTVRLPIGYFTLGPSFCLGTPFAPQVAQVYINAWAAVQTLVSRCLEYGIGILLDFHAVPGGANSESHSGTSSGRADLWNKKSNQDLALRCLRYMAQEAVSGRMDGVIGVQLCNEAQWEAPGMYKFYDTVIEKISEIDSSLPLYISDAWQLQKAIMYATLKNSVKEPPSCPVIVDTHMYYTFGKKDTSRSPQELIAQVQNEFSEWNGMRGNVFEKGGACGIYVGEYSCTLSQQTWSRVPENRRAPMTHQFGQVQTQRWRQMTCGSAFWTMKMDWMPGGDWGFKQQVDDSSITAPSHLSLPLVEVIQRAKAAGDMRQDLMTKAGDAHQSYWDKHAPGARFEHWRFIDGWSLGWADGRDFFLARSTGVLSARKSTPASVEEFATHQKHASKGGDRIGMIDLWILKRMREARCANKEQCACGWEWEQGFRQGVADFYTASGI